MKSEARNPKSETSTANRSALSVPRFPTLAFSL